MQYLKNTRETNLFINEIIKIDEGGWTFTARKDDSDLATFAGIRFITFNTYLKNRGLPELNSVKEFKDLALNGKLDAFVYAIYYNYMEKSGAVHLKRPISVMHFSCAINCGKRHAIIILQKAINELKGQKDALIIDGIIGPNTISAALSFPPQVYNNSLKIEYLYFWQMRYADIVVANADAWHRSIVTNAKQPQVRQWKNLRGWLNRTYKHL